MAVACGLLLVEQESTSIPWRCRRRSRSVSSSSPDLTTLIGHGILDANGYPLISQIHFARRRKIVLRSRLDSSKADERCR
jgi:hypothetical protein